MTRTFSVKHIPITVREQLAGRARQQATAQGIALALLDQAERIVTDDMVVLTGRNQGAVYSDGAWRDVTLKRCGHCPWSPFVCEHMLAVAFADLLARHAPEATQEQPQAAGSTVPGSGPSGGGLRGYGSRAISLKVPHRKNAEHNHCSHCGAFVDSGGNCHKCGRH